MEIKAGMIERESERHVEIQNLIFRKTDRETDYKADRHRHVE